MVGDGSAGATIARETVVGGRVTIASETSTGEIAAMTIDGAMIVSGTTTCAIALPVDFNIGIGGGKLSHLRDATRLHIEGVEQLLVS
jgi:hypothetical protein